jgi:hypothetical protein
MGGRIHEEADRAGVSRQRISQKLGKMQDKLSRKFLTDVDDIVLLKARQLAADSHPYGHVVRAGILGGQWDRGAIVQSFYAEAERQLLREPEENNDE